MGLTVENRGRRSHSSMTDVCIMLRKRGDILDARKKQFITDSCGAAVAVTGRALD